MADQVIESLCENNTLEKVWGMVQECNASIASRSTWLVFQGTSCQHISVKSNPVTKL